MPTLLRYLAAAAFLVVFPHAMAKPCDEEAFVRLGGIEQWVTIKGDDCANPVILFVHGGPGNPNTPYANPPYRAWEKHFTLVQWDQRGAGRTFGKNPGAAEATLTVERMAEDGTELAAYLLKRLDKKNVILFGGSWGSVLAVHMAKARPDLFAAYIGTGQLVHGTENARAGYLKLLGLARAAGDSKTVAALEGVGEPPWANPRSAGIVRRAGRMYEAKTATPAPRGWWAPAPQYATPAMQAEYEAGEEYSYLQFVGMTGKGMQSAIDLPRLGYDFQMPVFLVQGADDLVTVPEVAKRYFDSIRAPQKEFFLLPNTGHDPNPAMLETQTAILMTKVLPLASSGRQGR